MSGQRAKSQEWQFTGTHMLVTILSFFGVIIAVNLTLAYFASGTWTGLVVKNSYVASQQYNEKLAEVRRQHDTGWSSQFDYSGEKAQFALLTRDGATLRGFDVKALFSRPTHENEDLELVMTEAANGYETPVKLAPGVWNVEVTAMGADDRGYRKIFRLFVKQDG